METIKRQKGGLSLTRKIEEAVVVETPQGLLEITVIGVMGSKCRLLFTTHTNQISVFRKEQYERLQEEAAFSS